MTHHNASVHLSIAFCAVCLSWLFLRCGIAIRNILRHRRAWKQIRARMINSSDLICERDGCGHPFGEHTHGHAKCLRCPCPETKYTMKPVQQTYSQH